MTLIPKGIENGWVLWGGRPLVACPCCLQPAGLNHVVEANGTVVPSLDCPNDACSFHEHVRLGDWTEGRQDYREERK